MSQREWTRFRRTEVIAHGGEPSELLELGQGLGVHHALAAHEQQAGELDGLQQHEEEAVEVSQR